MVIVFFAIVRGSGKISNAKSSSLSITLGNAVHYICIPLITEATRLK